jgi:tyrosyl-tRNA synthetase
MENNNIPITPNDVAPTMPNNATLDNKIPASLPSTPNIETTVADSEVAKNIPAVKVEKPAPIVITDMAKINDVLTRGVENVFPKREDLEKVLLSGKRIRLYCGFDPSAPALQIGNAVLISKLAQFQALGHEVIFLVGDFTGMIGDPTDKMATRKKLTRAEVRGNSKNYKKQAGAYLKFKGENPAKVMRNSQWSDPLTFKDLIEVASNFTVQQMIQRDMFQARIKEEKPIFLHEFLYPLAQGYDSVGMDVDLEIGGNDQMFNMLCGRDLQKVINNKEKFVLTMKLLADDSGKKLGKTEGNTFSLDEDPNNMYGKVMSWPDGIIANAFEMLTGVKMSEIEEMKKQLAEGKVNPRDLKMKLAFEITYLNHGPAKAKKAQNNFIKTFQKKETPDEIKNYELRIMNYALIDLLVEVKLASSKSEARRLIEQSGIKVNNELVNDVNKQIEINKDGVLIQRGKRQFAKAVGV